MPARAPLPLALLGLAACGGSDPEEAPRPDVVLVSIDTLRADALSLHGNPHETSPHIDALAREGFVFERAYAPSAVTAPSHAAMFTGFGAWVHRVENLQIKDFPTPGLDDAFVTLAERFRAAGYETAAFTDGGPLGRDWNLQQGFRTHHGRLEGVEAKLDRTLAFLDQREWVRPLFLFLHTYQVHMPYVAPLEWSHRFVPEDYDGIVLGAERETRAALADGTLTSDGRILLRDRERFGSEDVDYLKRLYYGEVAFTDHHLQRLFDDLRERGTYDRTLVVVTSDHGEEFGEHGHFGHRHHHEEGLHVPLVVKLPRGPEWPEPPPGGRRFAGRVSTLGLYRTILDVVGIPCPAEVEGRSLYPAMQTGHLDDEPVISMEPKASWRDDMPWEQSVRAGGFALIRRIGRDDPPALFDLRSDPEGRAPLSLEGERAAVARSLEALLDGSVEKQGRLREFLLPDGASEGTFAEAATLRELEQLGYLGGEEDAPEERAAGGDDPGAGAGEGDTSEAPRGS